MAAPALDFREYKLLLDQSVLTLAPTRDAANAFWTETLAPLVEGSGHRPAGKFGKARRRAIRFADTEAHALDSVGYCLRRRWDVDDDDDVELCLKLRTPDAFVSGQTDLEYRDKFEEDVSPLHLLDLSVTPPAVRFAQRHATYSRYSTTAEREVDPRRVPTTMRLLCSSFGGLKDSLKLLGASYQPADALMDGPAIEEAVFRDTSAELGRGDVARAAFTLTHWTFTATGKVILEISFRLPAGEGPTLGLAHRAHSLFIGMQKSLPRDPKIVSKTSAALP